ncbi:hydrolase, alpha/beta fold family protein [Rhodobacterales bacterium HTCC2150]|nr:hydrolase, alpha/beta fold family protein [Rhodobacterales bacterium HTCC2150] [Rhodobacteraceae bacterium HTCC2150]
MIPLVLVHGFMGGSDQWKAQTEGLSDSHKIIAVDLPGFGKNAHLPVINTIGGFADWVISELRKMGVDRYNLLGHSMGGMIVQEMARRDQNRIKHLLLYGTGAIGVLPGRFETIATSKARFKQDGAKKTARRIAATWFLDKETAKGFEACATIAKLANPQAIEAGLDAMEAWSGKDFLRLIAPKTIVIWGDQDRTYAWDQINLLWTSIPNAALAVVPGCAHAVHAEKPDFFNLLISDFLDISTE